jgi:hypothetical protein
MLFDLDGLKQKKPDCGLILDLNLLDDANLFDVVSKHLDDETGLTLLQTQEELMHLKL